MRFVHWFALVIVIIGALNWGMVGFFNINPVAMIFSHGLARIIYALVGVAGLWAFSFFGLIEHRYGPRNHKH